MAYYMHIATLLSVLSVITCGNAIRCWTCSSDLDPHCADPFNHTSPTFNLHHTLTDCSTQSSPYYSLSHRAKSVCKKLAQTVNGHLTVVRSCEWLKSEDDQVGECSSQTYNSPKYITVEHCSTCDYDGCNGAVQYTTYLWKILIPAVIALLLRF